MERDWPRQRLELPAQHLLCQTTGLECLRVQNSEGTNKQNILGSHREVLVQTTAKSSREKVFETDTLTLSCRDGYKIVITASHKVTDCKKGGQELGAA